MHPGIMVFDESSLDAKYEVAKFNIRGGTQISTRATSIISHLTSVPEEGVKPVVIVLHASSREANKLISIVEIAKRDLASKRIKFCQYTALSSHIVEVERKPKPKGPELPSINQEDDEDSDDAFQTMGATEDTGKRKRSVPTMTVFMSAQPVKALRDEFG